MAGTMLVDVDRLEHFVPGSDQGVRDWIVIAGVRYQQLTPAVFATIARRVRKLRQAASEGRVSNEVIGAVEAEYAEIRGWALEHYGEQALREAVGVENEGSNVVAAPRSEIRRTPGRLE